MLNANYFFGEMKSVCFEIFQVEFQISWPRRRFFVVDKHVVDLVKIISVLIINSIVSVDLKWSEERNGKLHLGWWLPRLRTLWAQWLLRRLILKNKFNAWHQALKSFFRVSRPDALSLQKSIMVSALIMTTSSSRFEAWLDKFGAELVALSVGTSISSPNGSFLLVKLDELISELISVWLSSLVFGVVNELFDRLSVPSEWSERRPAGQERIKIALIKDHEASIHLDPPFSLWHKLNAGALLCLGSSHSLSFFKLVDQVSSWFLDTASHPSLF